jgi:hypothetical protein
MTRLDTAAMNLFLAELGQAVAPGAHGIVLMDKAGRHTAGDLIVPKNLSLVFLPPYSPELPRQGASERAQPREAPRFRSPHDSSLEEDGFELVVRGRREFGLVPIPNRRRDGCASPDADWDDFKIAHQLGRPTSRPLMAQDPTWSPPIRAEIDGGKITAPMAGR